MAASTRSRFALGHGAGQRGAFKGSPVVGYVRSAKLGDPQLDEWEAAVRAFAARHGYNLVEVVRDVGVSGVAVWKPGLEAIIRHVRNGRYVGIILIRLDQLASAQGAARRYIDRVHEAGGWIQFLP